MKLSMRGLVLPLSALVAVYGMVAPARAQQNIGVVTLVENDVTGVVAGQSAQLKVGDEVYVNEAISTGAGSKVRITFQDRTDLQIGAGSHVKLDSHIYSGNSGAAPVVFNATKGVFRFVSASGAHAPYQIRTPTATIGVRGTIFDVRVTPTHTQTGGRTKHAKGSRRR